MTTPIFTEYQRGLKNQGFLPDPEQEHILGHFEHLHQELLRSGPRPSRSVFQWLREQVFDSRVTAPKGIYLWGGVGRGKTYLMDLFYDCLPFSDKRRVHFHRFMLEIHSHLRNLDRKPDTLDQVAREIAQHIRILCFDELFVADIGDAMILSGLFKGLLERDVALVITSNARPQDLYQNGLQRQRFLPAIDLIVAHTKVIELVGDIDHRLKSLQEAKVYYVPHNHRAKTNLEAIFRRIANNSVVQTTSVDLNGRTIKAQAVSHGVIWFNFEVLCRGPHSKVDFVEISRTWHTLILSDIPLLGSDDDDAVRRFIELVDELYDRRVNLVASAAGAPELLYTGTRMKRGFQRVASRLWEFQSRDYIATSHRP